MDDLVSAVQLPLDRGPDRAMAWSHWRSATLTSAVEVTGDQAILPSRSGSHSLAVGPTLRGGETGIPPEQGEIGRKKMGLAFP
jgi:hypothetical protein